MIKRESRLPLSPRQTTCDWDKQTLFCFCDLNFDPMTLTYKFDLKDSEDIPAHQQ